MRYLNTIAGLFISLMVCSSQGLTASNPIAWNLNQAFSNPAYTGSLYTVTYTFTNHLPVQLANAIVIEKKASPASEFTYVDTCTGTRLLPNQSCTVQATLSALVAGTKFLQLSIAGYDRNIVPLPELVTVANSTLTGTVVGTTLHGLPNTMNANTSADYTFMFQNNSDTDATVVSVNVTQSTGTVQSSNTCTSPLLKNGGTCYVTGVYTPTDNAPAGQSVVASLAYTGPAGSPASTYTSTVLNGGVPGGPIVGSVANNASLPPLMTPGQVLTGTPGAVEFLFTNTSSDTTYYFPTGITPTVVLTWADSNGGSGSCPSTATATNPACGITQNNCIASLPSSPAACSVYTNFTAPTGAASSPPKTYTLTATLSYSSVSTGPYSTIATANTSATVIASIPTQRTIKMVNNCNFPLTYSLNGGATPCGTGAVADPSGACFWINYNGSNAGNVLAANTGTDYVTIPANDIGGVQWSGNISAMTGCDAAGTNCTQALCNDTGVGNCTVSRGFNQPATQVEITMLTNSADNYDGEVINGFHIPISMKPYYYINQTTPADDIAATPNNFSCGTPGDFAASIGTTGFGSCNWDNAAVPTTPAAFYYYKVGNGSGNACTNCFATEVCGLSQPVANAAISEPICGKFQGYWTPNELCTQTSNLPADVIAGLKCDTPLPPDFNLASDPYGNTYTSLMACHVAKGYTGPIYASCYTSSYTPPGSSTQCCGCVDWWDSVQTGGETILANTTSQTCPVTPTVHIDPQWKANIQDGIQWLKKACPSIYVYPFDDTTSKFTCTNSTQSGTNSTSYVVTFCAGNTGLPAGKAEGRGVT